MPLVGGGDVGAHVGFDTGLLSGCNGSSSSLICSSVGLMFSVYKRCYLMVRTRFTCCLVRITEGMPGNRRREA